MAIVLMLGNLLALCSLTGLVSRLWKVTRQLEWMWIRGWTTDERQAWVRASPALSDRDEA
jgi:hypothetical protein